MKIVDIKTKIIPSNPRSKNYPIGYPGGIASNSNGVTPDLSIYLLKEIWERNFEERTDEYGNEYLYIRKPLAIGGGATMYASNGVVVPSIFDGLPLDNQTIRKNPETGLIEVIGGTGTSFDENAMWSALSGSSENQINKSHLTTALDGYATQNWVIENYATKSELSAVSNKLSDFLEGSDADTIINKWKELEAFLSGMAETDNLAEILGTKADRSYVDSTFVTLATKQTITGEKTFSSVLNTAAIKASGEITTPSLAASDYVTIAGIKLRKLEDGALMLEGNLALTGALTMYASNGQSFDTIYDGLPIDNDTIYWQEVDGSRVLKAREGSGSSFDKSAMWTALAGSTTEQINKSHLTTALTGYATESWVSGKNYAVKATTLAGYGITDGINAVSVTGTGNAVTAVSISGHTLTLTKGSTFSLSGHKHAWSDITSGKPTTLSGYGITDAYTKTAADSRYVNVSGDTMTGNLKIQMSSRKDSLMLFQSDSVDKAGLHLAGSDGNLHSLYLTTSNLTWKNRTVWDSGNDGSNSGLDADLLDGTHKTGLLTALSTSSATNLSITVGGTTKTITDLYAYASTKLETARTLWGQSFDGTKNVSGDLTSVGNITGSGTFSSANTKVSDSVYINGIRLHKTQDGVITLEGNLAVTGGVTMYAVDPVTIPTIMDGIACDNTTIRVNPDTGVLEVLSASGEAGSVKWNNIIGKPSTFTPSAHTHAITDVTDLQTTLNAKVSSVEVTGTGNAVTAASITSGKLTLTKGATYNNYSLPLASSTTRGGVKIGYTENGKNYPVELSNEQMFVNVPWTDTKYTLGSFGITATANEINKLDGCTATTAELNYVHGVTGAIQSQLNNKLNSSAYTAADVLAKLKTVDGSNSGLDADLLDGTHKTALFTALTSSSGTNISITVGGTTKSITDLFANSAAKLETARTIWGQSFDGTKPVTGALTSVTDITGTGTFTGANLKATDSVYVNGIRLHKTADGVITLEGNLVVTGGVTMYAIDPVSASTIMDGVVVDGVTIKKENGKLVAVGGGEAGSVQWENISGKPSVFSTNIANITDLHSSWDAVLKAQKPAWLTAVSIATISDLHANWDALLKAAPSAYVTRWPTISEVTGKQNLIVKLNGGTTEGTNRFTYNATGAKTINITPAGIGAYTKSESDSKYPTKTGSGASGTWGIAITGNAGTATKLQTARTLWGRSFDGTGNVSGEISTCTRLRNSDESPLYLGNSNNASWVYTQDIASHNGVENWAIGITGTAWFKNVNIGYAHPATGNYLLNVDGVISCSAYTGRNIRIECDNAGNNLEARASEINNYNGKLYLQHDTSQDLICCKGGGNVGIGVDRPIYSLEVSGTIYTNGLVSAYGYSGNHIRIECDNNGGNRDQRIDEINNYTAPLYLQYNTGNNLICCNGGGNVGIGTTSPAAKLDVNGDIFCRSVESTYTSTANEEFSIDRSNLWCKAVPIIPNYKYRYVLGWQDRIAGGYITGYGIGTYRSSDGTWGSMTFEVCQYETNKTRKAQLEIRGRDNILWFSGDILAEGGGSFYGSDIRYKLIMQQVNLSLSEIAKAPSFVYRWNKKGMNNKLKLGGSAQYTQSVLPWAVEENDNFLSMDYATVAYTFAVHTARHLLTYETRTDKKIKKLENRVKYLEKQLKKLGYEEVRTLDDQSV
ncbi:beta strand repeat-containing protein [Phocaeicola coprocola]